MEKGGIKPSTTEEIARNIDGRTQDARDAVRVARLTPAVGVIRAVELLLGGWGRVRTGGNVRLSYKPLSYGCLATS